MRVGTMYGIHVGFLLGMVLQVTVSLLFDRYARRHPIKMLRSLARPAHPRLLPAATCSAACSDYHRADFHPDDHDTVELLDRWRQELTLQAA